MLNRLHVAVPQHRDGKERPPFIPGKCGFRSDILQLRAGFAKLTEILVNFLSTETVVEKRRNEALQNIKRKLEKELEEELGDDYVLDLNKNYDLPEEYKYDKIPEFWNGHNVADYIDPKILEVRSQMPSFFCLPLWSFGCLTSVCKHF